MRSPDVNEFFSTGVLLAMFAGFVVASWLLVELLVWLFNNISITIGATP